MKYGFFAMAAVLVVPVGSVLADDPSLNVEAIQGFGISRSYQQEMGARAGWLSSSNIYSAIDYSHFFSARPGLRGMNMVSGEGGYRFDTSTKFELIPYVGVGAALLSQNRNAGTLDRLLVNPGLKIDYPIGQLVVGLDNQYQIVAFHNSYALAGTFGIRF